VHRIVIAPLAAVQLGAIDEAGEVVMVVAGRHQLVEDTAQDPQRVAEKMAGHPRLPVVTCSVRDVTAVMTAWRASQTSSVSPLSKRTRRCSG
jgi:hypothetical protein